MVLQFNCLIRYGSLLAAVGLQFLSPVACQPSSTCDGYHKDGALQEKVARLSVSLPGSTSSAFETLPDYATYGSFSHNTSEFTAPLLLLTDPTSEVVLTGCSDFSNETAAAGAIVMVVRGNCPFVEKSQHAVRAGAAGLIVVNIDPQGGNPPPVMVPAYSNLPRSTCNLPMVMATLQTGDSLLWLVAETNSTLLVRFTAAKLPAPELLGADSNTMVYYACGIIVFSAVLALIMRLFHRRRAFQFDINGDFLDADTDHTQEANDLLDALESYTYEKHGAIEGADARELFSNLDGDSGGCDDDEPLLTASATAVDNDDDAPTCCICIEDFEDGDKVTKLPCNHEFHRDCIGPWLARHRTCPLCKRNVYAMHYGDDYETTASARRAAQSGRVALVLLGGRARSSSDSSDDDDMLDTEDSVDGVHDDLLDIDAPTAPSQRFAPRSVGSSQRRHSSQSDVSNATDSHYEMNTLDDFTFDL